MSCEFYKNCENILGVGNEYKKPNVRKTRWNNRSAGNGRFEGYGLIRYYSPHLIHVSFHNMNKTFSNENQVYEFLRCMKSQ